ncbi:hypothetical protein AIOL_004413 [Candidatus Rhodobacter oscarellae]|uniref:DUF4139 domain-containing protein n=1 Tax=Candidatus Rhodobacter oscarellae TaxID=1675527 RepID=A0A0J9E9X0_9RHOB|nr:hypothetical protein AIOL_004413 [Candidatus Rhodobacter lobularis]
MLTLGQVALDAELSFVAVPRRDESAFVMAELKNTGELLPPAIAKLYRGDRLVGEAETDLIPSGATARIGFGPEESLRLDHAVLDRETGDRGLVSVTNTRDETVRLSIENLGDVTRNVRLLHALPYSEQEDLVVTTRARPNPNETDIENRRGVSAWSIQVGAGATETITLTHNLSWPDGMELFWRP